jgi:hypothetical protein
MVTKAEIRSYIRQAAIARGIDPAIALRVYNGEGASARISEGMQSFVVKNGVRETSYGPFQLKVGGGLGDKFVKKTGLDVKDIGTYKQQVDFALNHAAKNGWGAWYGAAKSGVGKWDGLGSSKTVDISSGTETASSVPTPRLRPPMATAVAGGSSGSPANAVGAIFDFLGKEDPTHVDTALSFAGYSKPSLTKEQEDVDRAGLTSLAKKMGIDYAAKAAPSLYDSISRFTSANGTPIKSSRDKTTIASDSSGFRDATSSSKGITAKSVPTTKMVKTTSEPGIKLDHTKAVTAKMGGQTIDMTALARSILQGGVDLVGPTPGKEKSTAGTLISAEKSKSALYSPESLRTATLFGPPISSSTFKPVKSSPVVATPAIPFSSGVKPLTGRAADFISGLRVMISQPLTTNVGMPKLSLATGIPATKTVATPANMPTVPLPRLRPEVVATKAPVMTAVAQKAVTPKVVAAPVVTAPKVKDPSVSAKPKASQPATSAAPKGGFSSFLDGLGKMFSGLSGALGGLGSGLMSDPLGMNGVVAAANNKSLFGGSAAYNGSGPSYTAPSGAQYSASEGNHGSYWVSGGQIYSPSEAIAAGVNRAR